MFYEPSEIMAADKVTTASRGCSDEQRLLATPIEDVNLAVSPDPGPGRGIKRWIDPQLAAVYVIGNTADNLFKIGYTRELRRRVVGIQCSCPVQIVLCHFVYVVGNLIAKLVEADLHAAFAEERKHGEWFEIHPADVAEIMAAIIKERGYLWWDEQGRRALGSSAASVHLKDWERYSHRGNAHG